MLVALMGIGAANAGLRFGVRLGTNVNHLSNNVKDIFGKNNQAGFTGGVLMEYMTPLLGFGFDLGLQYAYMNTTVLYQDNATVYSEKNKNFIEIPLNLKYKFSLPIVGKFLAPYLFTGPSFDFKLDKNTFDAFKTRTFQTVWNLGLGIELVNHLQIAASYGFGLNNIAKITIPDVKPEKYHNNYWTITAAYLF